MNRDDLEKKVLDVVRCHVSPCERDGVTLDSKLSSDFCLDSLDKIELSLSLERRMKFKEKEAVWMDLLYGRDVTVRELCDFVEKRI